MITRTNGSKWGIKIPGDDFTPEIHSLINNAKIFIVVCGYNFSPLVHKTSIIPLLIAKKNSGINVLFIAPPGMIRFGNTNHTTNIQHLVNNDVGVILNSKNHSKWLISDYGYYYGSLNFTHSSMRDKVEVISFSERLRRRTIPKWMSETANELLNFAINETRRTQNILSTLNLGMINIDNLRILNLVLNKILKYNPSISKVLETLENYEQARLELLKIIDQTFLFNDEIYFNKLWSKISRIIFYLDYLAEIGNSIYINFEYKSYKSIDSDLDVLLDKYNRIHSVFKRQIDETILFIEYNSIAEKKQNKLSELLDNSIEILTNYKSESQ